MFGKVTLLFLVLCTLTLAQHHTQLSLDDVVESTWKFYNDAGLLGTMKFERDGTISGYINPNEAYWSFNGNILHIYSSDDVLSCKFVNTINDYFGKWHLNGRFLLEITDPTLAGWEHYLVQE